MFVDYYEGTACVVKSPLPTMLLIQLPLLVIRSPVSLETIRSQSSLVDKFLKQYDKTKDVRGKKALLQQEYEGYADWKEAEHDFDMMWRNAKRCKPLIPCILRWLADPKSDNVKGAQIYEDAQKLHVRCSCWGPLAIH